MLKISSIRNQVHSIRFSLTVIVLLVALPLSTLLLLYSSYAVNVIYSQVSRSDLSMTSLYMKQIDQQLDTISMYLINLKLNESSVYGIQNVYDANSVIFSEEYLLNKINDDNLMYRNIGCLFVYNAEDGALLDTDNSNYAQLRQFAKTLPGLPDSADIFYGWTLQTVGGKSSLVRAARVGQVVLGAEIDTAALLAPVHAAVGESGLLTFCSDGGQVTDNGAFIAKNGIALSKGNSDCFFTGRSGRFLLVRAHSDYGKFSLVMITPNSKILENLPNLSLAMYLILLAEALLILFCMILLKHVLFYPFHSIVLAMGKIRKGDLETRIEPFKAPSEFQQVTEAFNRMAGEIAKLKIDVYEQQLLKQEAEYRQLKAQMNPHFLVNALNTIYHLAKARNFEILERLSLCLSGYYRYILRNNADFVLLREEVAHIRNYLQIEAMWNPQYFSYETQVPDYLLDEPVPPLVIQVFVENIIKHAFLPGEPLHVLLRAELTAEDSGQPTIAIHIEDNGSGFPQEALELFNGGFPAQSGDGAHIGIQNVIRRLRHLYHEKAGVRFSNREPHGACVDIRIPSQNLSIE